MCPNPLAERLAAPLFVQVRGLEGKGIQDQRNGEQAANCHTKYVRYTSVVLRHFPSSPFIRVSAASHGSIMPNHAVGRSDGDHKIVDCNQTYYAHGQIIIQPPRAAISRALSRNLNRVRSLGL
jgi:hypothetical protein